MALTRKPLEETIGPSVHFSGQYISTSLKGFGQIEIKIKQILRLIIIIGRVQVAALLYRVLDIATYVSRLTGETWLLLVGHT